MLRLCIAIFIVGFGVHKDLQSIESYSIVAESSEVLAWEHVGQGINSLLLKDHKQALYEFKAAMSVIREELNPFPEIEFMLRFGEIVAYDNLGCRSELEQALGRLFIIINNTEEDEEGGDSESSLHDVYNQCNLAIRILKKMADLSPSLDVRSSLLLIIDEMSETIQPEFKCAGSLPFNGSWHYQYENKLETVEFCKKLFFKRCGNLLKKMGKSVDKSLNKLSDLGLKIENFIDTYVEI